jgi:hypothetical protein
MGKLLAMFDHRGYQHRMVIVAMDYRSANASTESVPKADGKENPQA